eukprot:SAG25_NODE_104_length_15398_cov_15.424472_5_plen_68_part_00
MDSDGSGELDREELLQLMQIMEPRRGITSEELDEAMAEIDTHYPHVLQRKPALLGPFRALFAPLLHQ